ncbi:lamin tail domain-containing protein [Myxococcota bacterium]|nr:lamin tail domain-containing protein [Myxococcota bacterium]
MRRWIPVVMFFFALGAAMTGGFACDGPKTEQTTETQKEPTAEATPEEQTVIPEEKAADGSETVADGTGETVADGTGETVADGTGETVADGTGETVADGTGETVADGTGETVADGTGETVADGTGETVAEVTPESNAAPDPAAATQITAVRGGTAGDIKKVAVTYLKPLMPGASATDGAGFFVQATQDGPALFVAVDPSTTTPPLSVGDIISFKADTVTASQGRQEVTAISNLTVDGKGYDVTKLAQDISAKADVVSALDSYESEIVSLEAKFKGAFASGGAGYSKITVESAGLTGDAKFLVRVPVAVSTDLGDVDGCTFSLRGVPMWRFTADAQVSFFSLTALTLKTCPAPKLLSAQATNATTVILTFNRRLDGTSILGGSQFTFDKGLTASSSTALGERVELTTGQQTADEEYTVTVAATVKDSLGSGVDATANSVKFKGFRPFTSSLMINEILADPPTTGGDANKDGTVNSTHDEFVEIVNISANAVNLSGYKILVGTAVVFTFGSVSLAAGKAVVVFGGGMTNDTEVGTGTPHSKFSGSLVYKATASSGLGLTNSGKIVTLQDATGATLDTLEYKSSGACKGDADESVNRAPDLTPYSCERHKTLPGATTAFSPGTKSDGSSF